MQKISTYLYPNRVQLLADLAGFTTEYTNVYQRTVKIYNGIDNTIEFDIKNADQKRIDLTDLTQIELHVMDAMGYALPSSPYSVSATDIKGIATVVIPADDLEFLDSQYLQYSVTAIKDFADVMLYADSKFGAIGKMELVKSALPVIRNAKEYKTFTGEIDALGNVVNHFSAIPATFYEAVPTELLSFTINMTNFIGEVWLQATTHSTISSESFLHAPKLASRTYTAGNSLALEWTDIAVGEYKYFRVSFQGDSPTNPTGTVDKVIVL